MQDVTQIFERFSLMLLIRFDIIYFFKLNEIFVLIPITIAIALLSHYGYCSKQKVDFSFSVDKDD